MEYKKLRALKQGLSKNAQDINVGEDFETDAVSAASLVEDGWAEEIDVVEGVGSDFSGEGNQTPTEGQEGGQTTPGQSENGKTDDHEGGSQEPDKVAAEKVAAENDTELEKARKALDGKYKRDELHAAAIAAGVEIAYDAKKAEIIEAVIVQGKKDALLK